MSDELAAMRTFRDKLIEMSAQATPVNAARSRVVLADGRDDEPARYDTERENARRALAEDQPYSVAKDALIIMDDLTYGIDEVLAMDPAHSVIAPRMTKTNSAAPGEVT